MPAFPTSRVLECVYKAIATPYLELLGFSEQLRCPDSSLVVHGFKEYLPVVFFPDTKNPNIKKKKPDRQGLCS